MFNYKYIIAVLVILTPSFVLASELPDHLQQSLRKAMETGDQYVHGAVIDYSVTQYPALEDAIKEYVVVLKREKEEAARKKAEKKPEKYTGNVSAGLNYTSGNTEKENINIASTLKFNTNDWHNALKLTARSGKEDDDRNAEEYKVKNHTRYNLSKKDYVSLDLEYVNDRFSGQEYRTTETLGYGYYFWREDDFSLSGQASVGARQSKLTDGESQNDFVQKLSSIMEWEINERISFVEDLSVSFTKEDVITESDSAFKTKLTDDLALLLVFNVEHLSRVPENRENTDTYTSLNLLYDF